MELLVHPWAVLDETTQQSRCLACAADGFAPFLTKEHLCSIEHNNAVVEFTKSFLRANEVCRKSGEREMSEAVSSASEASALAKNKEEQARIEKVRQRLAEEVSSLKRDAAEALAQAKVNLEVERAKQISSSGSSTLVEPESSSPKAGAAKLDLPSGSSMQMALEENLPQKSTEGDGQGTPQPPRKAARNSPMVEAIQERLRQLKAEALGKVQTADVVMDHNPVVAPPVASITPSPNAPQEVVDSAADVEAVIAG